MAKNMKFENSKLAKLFLLSCASTAIFTAFTSEAMGAITVNDVLHKAPEYQALSVAEKLNILNILQGSNEYDSTSASNRRLFNKEVGEVRIQKATDERNAPVLNGARERRAARAVGNVAVVAAPIVNSSVATGRVEQEFAMDNKLQILNILANSQRTNAVTVKDKVEKAVHSNIIESLSTPFEKLKYAATTPSIDHENNLKIAASYVETPLTKEAFEHTFFATNITDPNVRNKDVKVDYFKPGQSTLLRNFKSVATPEVKEKLLNQFKNYVNQNLVELEANKSSIASRQTIMKLADPAKLTSYLSEMTKVKEAYIDNGQVSIIDKQTHKVTDERGLKQYNKILKDAGLITQELSGKSMQALIDNFGAFTMNDLALALNMPEDVLQADNKRLVGLGNTLPPPRPTGRVVRNLNNLDAIENTRPELKVAGYNLKAKEDAADVVAPARAARGTATAADEALAVPNTIEGQFHNDMYLVKNTKNPEKLQVRILGAETDLGITIRTLLTLEQNKSPAESLGLFAETNPNKDDLIVQAKKIWDRLKDDNLIKQTSGQALILKNKIADGTFFEELFNEQESKAIDRLNYTFARLPQDLQDHITLRSNEIKIKDELQGQKAIVSKINYIAKNQNVLGADSLKNEVERVVNNFATLDYSDKLDLALNREDVNINITLTPKANEVTAQVNNWINKNIVNLVVENNLAATDLISLQNKAKPELLSKIYETAVDTKAQLLKKVLVDNAADLSKASKVLTEKDITDAVQNNFNAKMLALTPDAQNFSKEQIVKFINIISDEKIKLVLNEIKKSKNSSIPVINHGAGGPPPLIRRVDGVPPPPPPPPLRGRTLGFNGLGMDGLVQKMGTLKPIEDLFPKKVAAAAIAYVAPTSEIGKKYEASVQTIIAAAKNPLQAELAKNTKGKEIIKALIIEEVFEKYTTKNPNILNDNIDQLAQEIKEGTDIEFIGPKGKIESGIDQETRNVCVRLNQDIGLMQQLKKNNPKLAAVIESVAVNEEEVAKRLPDSAAAQAVRDGDVNYDGVQQAVVPVAPVAPLVLPEELKEELEREVINILAEGGAVGSETVVEREVVIEDAPVEADNERILEVAPVEVEDVAVDAPIAEAIPEAANLAVAGGGTDPDEPKADDKSELELENTEQEEAKKPEEAKIAEEVEIIEEAKKAAEIEAIEILAMANDTEQDKKITEAIRSSIYTQNIYTIVSSVISNRMMHTTSNAAAVAAGDEDERLLDKGLWISGIYGTNKRNSQKGFTGYKGQASGGTIGFDIGFENFKDLIGIAYTKLDSKFKSNGSKVNTNIDSHILALYGQKELPNNFVVQAMFAYNHNNVKAKINRSGTIASGKYKNNSYNFESLLNYNYTANNIIITPNIGVRYGHSKDGIYKENNVGMQHLNIASKSQNLWTSILGSKVALAPQKVSEGLSITPALHASVENYFNNKSKKLTAKVKWKDREAEENIALPKQPKLGYNLGASVLTEKGNVSVLLEYNCHLQKKYQSHQGFVKLKVKL